MNEGALIQDTGLKNGVDLLANAVMVRNAVCGTPGDDSVPAPTPPTPEPVPTPVPTVFRPADPIPDIENSVTRRDACLLVTDKEVAAAMKLQGVVANEVDPLGDPTPNVQGCEFDGPGALEYTTVVYFQADASSVFDAFRSSAQANGFVQGVPGLGDRAFAYSGVNGPGIVVSKGDKLFTMEFGGMGNGAPEANSLLVLAQQAVGRVR